MEGGFMFSVPYKGKGGRFVKAGLPPFSAVGLEFYGVVAYDLSLTPPKSTPSRVTRGVEIHHYEPKKKTDNKKEENDFNDDTVEI